MAAQGLARLAASARSRQDSAAPPLPAAAACAASVWRSIPAAATSSGGTITAPSASAIASRFCTVAPAVAVAPELCGSLYPAAAAAAALGLEAPLCPPLALALAAPAAPLLSPSSVVARPAACMLLPVPPPVLPPPPPPPPKMAAACESSRSCCTAAALLCWKVTALRAPRPAAISSSSCPASSACPLPAGGGCTECEAQIHWLAVTGGRLPRAGAFCASGWQAGRLTIGGGWGPAVLLELGVGVKAQAGPLLLRLRLLLAQPLPLPLPLLRAAAVIILRAALCSRQDIMRDGGSRLLSAVAALGVELPPDSQTGSNACSAVQAREALAPGQRPPKVNALPCWLPPSAAVTNCRPHAAPACQSIQLPGCAHLAGGAGPLLRCAPAGIESWPAASAGRHAGG